MVDPQGSARSSTLHDERIHTAAKWLQNAAAGGVTAAFSHNSTRKLGMYDTRRGPTPCLDRRKEAEMVRSVPHNRDEKLVMKSS